MAEDLVSLLNDIKSQMIEDSELIASEFSGGKEWFEYCKDTKAIIDRIDKVILELEEAKVE